MSSVRAVPLPRDALLAGYAASGAYTDCYATSVPGHASLAQFMAAFYTTHLFKLERWILAQVMRLPSSDREAGLLAEGQVNRFAAWQVEAREGNQALLAAGRTRSWLMVTPRPADSGTTTLFFGSAVVPRRRGGLGWQFNALLGFHKLYSRMLLRAAARRLARESA